MGLFPLFTKALKESIEQFTNDLSSNSEPTPDRDKSLAEQMRELYKEKPMLSNNEKIAEKYYQEILQMIKYRASTGHKGLILRDGKEQQYQYLEGVIGKIVKEKLLKDGFDFDDYLYNDGIGQYISWEEGEDWENRWR